MLDLVHRGDDRLIVQVGEQVFGLFAEENLLLEIVLASLFLNVELVATAGEEVIADIAECLAEFVIVVTARAKRDPFLLDVANGIGELVGACAFGKLADLFDHFLLLLLDVFNLGLEFRVRFSHLGDNLIHDCVEAFVDGFYSVLRDHANRLPFSIDGLVGFDDFRSDIGDVESFELFAEGLLLFEILLLGGIHFFKVAALLFEEGIASGAEARPDFVGLALRYRTRSLPRILQLLELGGSGIPVGRVLDGFGFDAEGDLLFVVGFAAIVFALHIFLMLSIEGVHGVLEALVQSGKCFLRDHADVLPVFLDFLHGLELVLPENFGVCNEFFDLLAEGFLVNEVLLAFGVLFFDERSAVFLDLVYEGLETVAVVLELGCRNRADFTPLAAEFAELGKHGLARSFLGERVHFFDDGVAVLFVVPVFPLLHFLETGGGNLVFLPEIVVLELLFADDFLPFLISVAENLVDFAELLVLVDVLDAFDEAAELLGIFFDDLLGLFVEGADEFIQLSAECIVSLEDRIVTFEEGELFPFADDGMQMLARVFIDFRFGKRLETFEKALADGNFFFACVFRFCGRNFNLLCFLGLEVGVVEALDQGGVHDGLAFVPFLDDCVHAVGIFFGRACFDKTFKFCERFREAYNLCLLFGFGIFGGLLCGVCFVVELVEAFVNFIERCCRFAHAESVCFVHQVVKLRLGGKCVLLGGEEVSLLDEGFALALQEFGCLFAVVFSIFLCTNFVRNFLADGGVLGTLDEVGLKRFRCHAVCSLQCDFFAGIARCNLGEQGLFAALLDKFFL